VPGDDLDTQVIVVGAGPVGLLLAAELRLAGADTIVLERRATPTTESRASTLHARTMEIFDSRGLLGALDDPPHEPRGHFGGLAMDLTLPGPFPGQWKVLQTRTERVLQDRALALGAQLRRGHELIGLGTTDGHVEVLVAGPDGTRGRLRAGYLVGCDGADSTVRRLAGLEFPGQGAQRELLRADVAGLDIPNRRFERHETGMAVAARRPDGVTRVMVHEFGRDARPRTAEPSFGEVADAWKRTTGEDISAGRPLWLNAFDDTSRQAAAYRSGRILLAGDAAHQQMPIGGQALNLGLQDAFNLGWKLAAEVTGSAPAGLLDTYHAERHAVGRGVLAGIRAQATLLLGGAEAEPLRSLMSELLTVPGVREHLAGGISGLGVRYDVGAADHPVLGRRLPPATLDTPQGRRSTAELSRPGGGLLLDTAGALADAAAGWAGRVTVVRAGRADGVSDVLVRPDGYVAWVNTGRADLPSEMRRWFGAPVVSQN
jgi:2-polyprenyl-6-methoxyphenol hydroxylase-like FAD-dependent oxidoreductase